MKIVGSGVAIVAALISAGIPADVMPVQIINTRREVDYPFVGLIYPERETWKSKMPANRMSRRTGVAKARRDSKKRRKAK